MKTLLFVYLMAVTLLLAVYMQPRDYNVVLPATELETLQPTFFAQRDSLPALPEIMLPDVEENPNVAAPSFRCYMYLTPGGYWVRNSKGRKYWQPAPHTKIEVPCECDPLKALERNIA